MSKIYIETSSFYGNRSGVGRYGLCISQALMNQRPNDSFTLFSFLRPGRQIIRDFSLPSNARLKYIRWFPGRAFSMLMRYGLALPMELFGILSADIVFFPNFIAWASVARARRVSVVHDLAYLYYPEHVQAKNLAYLRRQLPVSLKRSAHIIAVSESTKRDIIKHFAIQPDKISVVYNAVDRAVFNPEASKRTEKVLAKFNIPTSSYLLFVGNIEPRKNLEGLLRAYARSYKHHKLPLVIVGAKGWNDSNIEAHFSDLVALPIYRTNFVHDEELAALYASATAFIYPSHYEGFGIPCLEAMASGCPVICSNNSSFPEVVGNAAITVDADNLDQLAQSIIELASKADVRRQLRGRGLQQARKFTWQSSGQKLSEVLQLLTTK